MRKVYIYIACTFIMSWGGWGLLALSGVGIAGNMGAQILVPCSMFFPLVGFFITRQAVHKEEKLTCRWHLHLKGHLRWYLIALLLPTVLAVLGSVVYFTVFSNQYSLTDNYFTSLLQTTYSQIQGAVSSGAQTPITQSQTNMIFWSQILSGVFLAPFINMLFAFGEEAGWRGFLFPALCEKFKPGIAILITGVIWGVWHAPLTMMGHNYGVNYPGYPIAGILVMCVFCTTLGCLLSYLTYKTDSIWPAALAHGAVNAIAALPMYFLKTVETGNQLLGPSMTGLIGGIPLYLLAAVVYVRLSRATIPPASEPVETAQ